MENHTPKDNNRIDNFILILNDKQYIIEITLNQGKLNLQAVNNIGNDIINYESKYDFEGFLKINEYFKFCKEINNIYDFIIKLKNSNSLSLLQEKDIIYLCLHLSEPIKDIIKIPLNKSKKSYDLLRQRLIKRDIKGYSQDLLFIEKEIEKQLKKNVISYDLIYKASRDGDKSENFHSKCDNIHNTLVIITTTDSNIFGAFTTKTWIHSGYVSDPFAFAFSINNQKIYNIIDNKNGEHAIYADNSYGPCFGNGTDFGLYSGCLGINDNWCNCKNTYNFNGEHMNQNNFHFKVLDYEVYHIILD